MKCILKIIQNDVIEKSCHEMCFNFFVGNNLMKIFIKMWLFLQLSVRQVINNF